MLDLTGQTFGRWTCLGPSEAVNGKGRWLCRCACGVRRAVATHALTRGGSRSCGCGRQHKRERVLSYFETPSQVSEVAAILGVPANVISEHTRRLKDAGLLRSVGVVRHTGGRPAHLLQRAA